jgi:tRNA G18 (ribose-2'-O)-methylase SpoU
MKELGRPAPEVFKEQEKTPVVLVLDNVRSALNVGSAFRTADAFALEKIYLCGITATPPHREILKTALGADETISWEYLKSTKEAVQRLKTEGWKVLAVEQATGCVPLQNFEFHSNGKYALVFGNEVTGVSEEAMKEVDGCIEVPQFGTKHSLNIAVCIGVVAWDFFKHLRLP